MIDPNQQERWQSARERRTLGPGAPTFGRFGLCGMLDGAGIGVVVMPANELSQQVEFESELLARIPERFLGVTGNGVGELEIVTSTSDALVRCSRAYGGESWRGFIAVERNGGVQCGLGSGSRYEIPAGMSGAPRRRALRLYNLAHLIRVAVELQARVIEWAQIYVPESPVEGPFEIVVAIPEAEGMVLGCLNGWPEPQDDPQMPPRAMDEHVLVRVQVGDWPVGEAASEDLILRTLNRTCEAFGDRNRRYLQNGTMAKSYA